MKTRKLILTMMLAVVTMAMAAVAPAFAGTTASSKAAQEWDCINTGVRQHCAKTNIGDWLANPGPGKTLNLLVFDESGEIFLGTETTETLRITKDGSVPATHHWVGGTGPS